MATNTERQAAFKARMRAEGKKQITVWVTSEEELAIKAILAGGSLPVMTQPELPAATPGRPDKAPTPAPPEADIRLMRDQGLSWRAIAKALNEKGVPPADGMRKWTGPDLMRIYG